jgi:hypothetical protein
LGKCFLAMSAKLPLDAPSDDTPQPLLPRPFPPYHANWVEGKMRRQSRVSIVGYSQDTAQNGMDRT